MSTNTITLELPSDLYERVRQIAEESNCPLENIIVEALKLQMAAASALPLVPSIQEMTEAELWSVVQRRMPGELRLRFQQLLSENSERELSQEEKTDFDHLMALSEELSRLRSQALLQLHGRGVDISTFVG